MKRAALIAGISIAAVLTAEPTEVRAWPGEGNAWSGGFGVEPYYSPVQRSTRPRFRPAERKSGKKSAQTPDKTPPIPSGPLHIIVSIDKQRATLFADGMPVASTAISSGTASHPTPMGVFSIIQKSRHHVSNLYNASMPYMQRITWSGSALHQGPLPGYPASHGCVRLTENFAQLLWKATKMGARVIVTRPEVAPVEFAHARLFVPRPKLASDTPTATVLLKTADATNALPVAHAPIQPIVTEPAANTSVADQPTKRAITDGAGGKPEVAPQTVEPKPVEAKSVETKSVATKSVETKSVEAKPGPTIAAPASIIVEERSKAKPATHALTLVDERPKTMPAAIVHEAVAGRPISVFVSLKDGKLYVRQGWKPLFETPASFQQPDQPVGTHVFTAMGERANGDGLRWTAVSIPSATKRVAEAKVSDSGRKSRHDNKSRHDTKPVEIATPMPSASAALDRIIMPPDAVERIAELITPGSSLIVSDNRLSDETGEYTDFIVLTR
jgi:lipoprotein-anchoring transpeptidase ErfK/SrfK